MNWFYNLALGLGLMVGWLEGSWFKSPMIKLKKVDFKNVSKKSLKLKLTLNISNQNSLNCRYFIEKVVLYDEKDREIGFIKKTSYKTLRAKKNHELSVETNVKIDEAIKSIFSLLVEKELHFKIKGKVVINMFWFLFLKVSFKEDVKIDAGEVF